MALTQLTKIDGRGINTTSDYRVGILTAIKFVGPFDGTGGNFAGVVTATDGVFSGNVTIGGTLTYEDVTNIDSVGIITAQKDIHVGAGVSAVGVGTFGGGIFIDDSITHFYAYMFCYLRHRISIVFNRCIITITIKCYCICLTIIL